MASIFPHSITAVISHRQRILSEDAHSTMIAMERQDSNQSASSMFENSEFGQSRESNQILSLDTKFNPNLIEQQQKAQYPSLADMFQPIRRMFIRMPHNT